MYGEDGQIVDVKAVREAVHNADVLLLGFRMFPERLLVDMRRNEAAGPMVRVVEPVRGVEERMFWLGRNRPQFGMPERFTFFVWPHSISFLEDSGVLDLIRQMVAAGDGQDQLHDAVLALQTLERAATQAVIKGHPWRTVWQAGAAPAGNA